MESTWIYFALAHSVMCAIAPLLAEYFQRNTLHILFWMRLLAGGLYLPILLFVPPPDEPLFYIATIATVFIFGTIDLAYIGLSTKNGAGLITRLEPISSWFAFILWTLVTPSLLLSYISNPVRGLGIVASIGGSIYFALQLRKCPVSWPVLRRFLPFLMGMALGLVFSKTAMNHSPFHSGVLYYGLIQCWGCVVLYTVLMRYKILPIIKEVSLDTGFFERRTLLAGVALAISWLIGNIIKYYGITLVENPAYITVVGLLAPFWVLLVYKAVGRKEKADIKSGLGIITCTALLILFTKL